MDPGAQEFIPSWLPKPATPAEPAAAPLDSWEDDESVGGAGDLASTTAALDVKDSTPAPKAAARTAAKPAPAPAKSDASPKSAASTPKTETGKSPSSKGGSSGTGAAPLAPPAKKKGSSSAAAAGDKPADISGRAEGADEKKCMSVVLLGHVDAGKSTIAGHILFLTGNVDERTMEKFEKEAKALNREGWKFAYALDSSEQEKAKGKTEEYGQAAFTTDARRFTILDAPGHKNYVPHMIGGAAQADIGILVISARKGEFEAGFENGGQTREHAMLAKTSGIRQLVVIINKLDDASVVQKGKVWSKKRFDECKSGLEPYLRGLGWNIKEIEWIPVSGLGGQNLKDKCEKDICPWYQGVTLLEHLDTMKLPERPKSGSVKMPISESHKEMGTMVKGKLESGVIREGESLVLMPNKVDVLVDAVELEGTESSVAEPGDSVRLRLKGISEDEIRTGMVLCSPTDLVSYTNTFDVRLMILEHKNIICAGYSAVMHIHQLEVECTISKLLGEIDKKTGKIGVKNPKFVKPGMKAIARMVTAVPICIEPFVVFPQLGRFMIRDEGKTIAVGTVLKIKEMKDDPGMTN